MASTKKVEKLKNATEERQKNKEAVILNDDCMRHILSFLSIKDRIKIQSVCKNWQRIVNLPWSDIKELQVSFNSKTHTQDIMFTVPILKKVLKHCGITLKKLKLGHFQEKGFNKSVIMIIIKSCPNLTFLDMTGMILTEKCAELLSDNFHNLTHLGIGNGWIQNREIISRIFSSNKCLQEFNFGPYITLKDWLLRLPVDSIESLTFDGGKDLPWECMTKVLLNIKKLRALSVYCYHYVMEHIDELLSVLPKANLEELRIRGSNNMSFNKFIPLRNVSDFIHLKVLDLSSSIFNNETLAEIGKNCKLLTSISLSDCRRVTDDGVKSLLENLKLQELHMDTLESITDKCFGIEIPTLQNVTCTYCSKIVVNASVKLLMVASENLKYIIFRSHGEVNVPDIMQAATAYTEHRTKNLKIILQGIVTQETLYVTKNLFLEVQAGQT